jgi:uncharacterized protein YbaR (Trm112 family)
MIDETDETAPQPAARANPEVRAPSMIDPRLLELLVCPLTKTSLRLDTARGELVSRAARLAFPIRDGVPMMAAEAARPLADEEI